MKNITKAIKNSSLLKSVKKTMKLSMTQRIIEFTLKDLFKSLIKEAFS